MMVSFFGPDDLAAQAARHLIDKHHFKSFPMGQSAPNFTRSVVMGDDIVFTDCTTMSGVNIGVTLGIRMVGITGPDHPALVPECVFTRIIHADDADRFLDAVEWSIQRTGASREIVCSKLGGAP